MESAGIHRSSYFYIPRQVFRDSRRRFTLTKTTFQQRSSHASLYSICCRSNGVPRTHSGFRKGSLSILIAYVFFFNSFQRCASTFCCLAQHSNVLIRPYWYSITDLLQTAAPKKSFNVEMFSKGVSEWIKKLTRYEYQKMAF